MAGQLIAEVTIRIAASTKRVWEVLTTPSLISEYLFGTHVETDWKEGSPITYQGEWDGHQYTDKGTILRIDPPHLFESTYWSPMGGKEDRPENYNKVTYSLGAEDGATLLKVSQDNIATEEEKQKMNGNWTQVLEQLKEVAERNS